MKGWCVAMSSVSSEEFGKDLGLVHEAVVTGRKVGADRDFWAALAHDESLFRQVVEMFNGAEISLTVDYDRSVEDGVEAGRYDGSDRDITSGHFPSDKKGKTEVRVRPIGFNRLIESDEVIAELDKMGYRPADLQETLVYGEQHPEGQRSKGPIVGLGLRWQIPFAGVYVPVLRGDVSWRRLDLDSFALGWHKHCRFLAVRKHQ